MMQEDVQPVTIKALIFDVDGVITDTVEYHYRSWRRLADEEGIPFTREDNEKLRGVTRRESLRRLLKGRAISEEDAAEWMARKNNYFLEYLDEFTPADRLPGVAELISAAKDKGLKLGVASASRNARPVLERLELLDQFDVVADAYTVTRNKPHPDLFMWVAGALGVMAHEAIVFEDSEAGVEAALTGGFHVVGIGSIEVQRAHLIVPSSAGLFLSDLIGYFSNRVEA
jgi:beta-phosphoglucomutase